MSLDLNIEGKYTKQITMLWIGQEKAKGFSSPADKTLVANGETKHGKFILRT